MKSDFAPQFDHKEEPNHLWNTVILLLMIVGLIVFVSLMFDGHIGTDVVGGIEI